MNITKHLRNKIKMYSNKTIFELNDIIDNEIQRRNKKEQKNFNVNLKW